MSCVTVIVGHMSEGSLAVLCLMDLYDMYCSVAVGLFLEIPCCSVCVGEVFKDIFQQPSS